MSSSSESQWVVVGGCVALTLQLLRLSMDMVQVASKTTVGKKPTVDKKTSYGATGSAAPSRESSVQSGLNKKSDEEQPLIGQSAEEDEASRESRRSRMIRVHGFAVAWAVLALWFLVEAILGRSLLYSSLLLYLSASVMAGEGALLKRDPAKERYGAGQRFLHLAAAVILWSEFAVPALNLWQRESAMSGCDLGLVVAASAVLVLALLDNWLTHRLPTPLNEAEAKKKKLDRAALLMMLKPYFWPSATDCRGHLRSSAFWNRVRAIATWFCVFGSKVCGLVSPLFLGWATTSLAHGDYAGTIVYSIAYAVVSFLGTTLKEAQSLVYLKVAQAAFVQLAETAFEHLHSLSLDWHLRKKLGEVLRAMDRGIAACDTLMKYLFLWLVPAMVECLVVCIIFATYFHYLPLALTVFYFVFAYVLWTILVTLWRKKFRKALVASDNEYHDIFTDSMVNFETVKFFTAEQFERQRFADAVARYQSGTVSVQSSLSLLNISQQIILKACLATALSLAALGIRQRGLCCIESGCESAVSDCCSAVPFDVCPGMQVGDFVAVLTYTLNLFAPLNFLGSVYNAVVMAIVDLTSMSELLAENPDVVDAPDAMELPAVNKDDPDIAVEFDNVVFHYPTQNESKGLKGLSFKMKRGTVTAIVGPTGAGKTTVSRLLFRFYDVLGGAVKVNGVDVRSVTQKSLRKAIGVVPQAASMFNDTIRFNLKYGKQGATQEEIEQAAADAQLTDFIKSLDDGWETMVGDRGLKLSGGEKQRAAIARCLLKNPPFVLLDEATSALDTLTEKSVQDALDRLGKERTVLVIAHRLGTIRNADNIIVIKDGEAVEQGTHDELLSQKGIYADMWNMQLHSTSSASDSPRNPIFPWLGSP